MGMREKLIELLKKTPIAEINGHIAKAEVCFVSHVFESMADHLIANDVVPVHCKNCQSSIENSCNGTLKCGSQRGLHRTVEPDEFCSWGERDEL